MPKKHYNDGRVVKHVSLNIEREKDLIHWFEKNKGRASVLIKKLIREDMKNEIQGRYKCNG